MAFPQTFRAYHSSEADWCPASADQGAHINPVDYLLRGFLGKQVLGKSPSLENPFGIGFDASGEVVEVGGEVKSLNIGDEVYAMTPFSAFGTLAEYVLVDEEYVSAKPTNLSFDEAAAIPLSGLTAFEGVFDHAKLQKGETVLILGGSSSVGMFAVQFAVAIGARVITTASAAKAEMVKSLGAEQVIDYKTEKWQDVVEAHSIDVVFNCGMENGAWNEGAQVVLKKNTGRFVTLLPLTQPVKESEFGAKLVGHISVIPSGEKLKQITKFVEAKEVKPVIDTVYSFENTLDAYAKLKTRHASGKLVVKVQ